MTRRLSGTVIAASLALIGTLAQAQTTDAGTGGTTTGTTQETQTGTTTATAMTTVTPNGAAAGRLVAQFTALAGSEDNATSLVKGLRTGSEITLTTPSTTATGSTTDATGTSTGTTAGTTGGTPGATSASISGSSGAVTFAPPTRPMGYGNVRIALSLAQARLAAEGITQPTPQQLQAALIGTTTTATAQTATQTQGILQMRASGMGWGAIANSIGFKLGAVMSGRVPLEAATAAQSASSTAATAAGTQTGKSSGAVTASGASTDAKSHGYSRKSSGIVTATGAPMGHAHQNSRAITGSGNPGHGHGAGKSAATRTASAQGGKGNAYGHSK